MSPEPDRREGEPLVIEVDRFEHVPAGEGRVLLRVDGRYVERRGKRLLDAALFVDDGLAIHRHSPLPDPERDGDDWLWRAAFDVPASYLTDARTSFALEADPGRLYDLPRPSELLISSTAIPLSGRVAHTARRYAAAVAVLLTVAVAPGVLPSTANPQVLKVRQPDGSIVYMTSDGQRLASIPPNAVVVDETAQQAPSTTQPSSTQPPQQDQQQAPAQPSAPAPQMTPGAPLAHDPSSTPKPKQDHSTHQPTAHTARHNHRHPSASPHKADHHAPAQGTQAHQHSHAHHHANHHHPNHHPAGQPTQHEQPGAPAGTQQQLTPLPSLAVGNSQLQPLPQIGGGDQPSSAPQAPGLQPIDTLGPSTGQGPGGGGLPDVHQIQPGSDRPFIPLPQLTGPASGGGEPQHHSGSQQHAPKPPSHPQHPAPSHPAPSHPAPHPAAPAPHSAPAAPFVPSGPPSQAPAGFPSLPGPSTVTGVPNFVIQRFQVPPFLLPIYQAAGMQYGIRWEVLAAINEIETDYGRNLSVSSAGALGWMQFMPATWQTYGVDANRDGRRDPFNPVDAVFAAARYLKAAGGDKNIRQGIFAYNHATWYVDSVMLRARLLAGYPPDFIGSLTGLTEGRFPIAARARYGATPKVKHASAGQNAANVVSSTGAQGIDIYSNAGAPAVAVNDGVIKAIGHSRKKGWYVVLQDVYGNQYTYSGLGSVAKLYPVPKPAPVTGSAPITAHDPTPTSPASAGLQRPTGTPAPAPAQHHQAAGHHGAAHASAPAPAPIVGVKQRLFANPARPNAQVAGGFQQLAAAQASGGFETYDGYFAQGVGLNSRNAVLKRLRKGANVIGGTVLGHLAGGPRPSLRFEVRPAGKGAPLIDPKPILDGWKLLASTAIYRASGKNALYGQGALSIGETMLLPKPLLEQRVLQDPRIKIYAGGRNDIKTGQIDRRVLVVLEYLADSGLHPTVSCLKTGHSELTSSGNVSEHASGNAVDIAAINGTPITGHQGPGSITETAVRRMMQLQGTLAPHQIISLMDLGQNTLAMPDHYNHIHVGFHPLFGTNAKLGRIAQSVLRPDQWGKLVQHLGQIQNPAVPTTPSKYAIPVKRGSGR